MKKDNKNFFLAMALSFLVIWAWQYFYVQPHNEAYKKAHLAALHKKLNNSDQDKSASKTNVSSDLSDRITSELYTPELRNDAIAKNSRIEIDTKELKGSVNLAGAKIDDIILKEYHVQVNKNSPQIQLLKPEQYEDSYLAEIGFANEQNANISIPNGNSQWQIVGENRKLTATTPITLQYSSKAGLLFRRVISVDDKFMFTIQDSVTNNSNSAISLQQYGRVSREKSPTDVKSSYLLHEGLIGVVGSQGLEEKKYSDMQKMDYDAQGQKKVIFPADKGGFIGITDKYWAATVIPDQNISYNSEFKYLDDKKLHYQAKYETMPQIIQPGQTLDFTNHLFVGAKRVEIIEEYQKSLNITKFSLLIDWGLFSFITKPMFALLHFLYKFSGNFGIAILLVTVLLKIILFPLANRSFASMAKMRMLQPKLNEIKNHYASDRVQQQQAIMELYRKEQVNPMAGCLPMLIQMPIFFALYKVLYITIEMRHAPFFGWIHDLAAPDPTSIFNLFGLLPYTVPHYLTIGAWPIIMGITMFLQMRLNPAPADPIQAKIFTYMPLIFTFTLSAFPVGLVIYWAWNNSLTILQQIIITRRHGGKVELIKNIKELFGK